MRARVETTSPITDPSEARQFDLGSRVLRITLLLGITQWVFVAGLLVMTTSIPPIVAALGVLVGVVYTLLLVRYFARTRRARLSQFTDPITGELRLPNGRLPLPPRLRLGSWLLVIGEVAALLFFSQQPGIAHPQIRPGSVPIPYHHFQRGPWTATGRVISAVNAADEPAGTVLTRPWTFFRACDSCRMMFRRETLYGVEEAVLTRVGDIYTANFPPSSTPCAHYPGEDAGSDRDYTDFTLWWLANGQQLHADEHTNSVGPCPGSSTTEWVALRTDPSAHPPAPGP